MTELQKRLVADASDAAAEVYITDGQARLGRTPPANTGCIRIRGADTTTTIETIGIRRVREQKGE